MPRRRRGLVITVSGLHGSGTSTQARRLAKALGLRYVSAGLLFRRIAEERGLTLEELSRLAEENPELDRMIDERTREEARRGGVVIDAALAGWMAGDADLKIFLTAPLEERVRRIARREGLSLEEAMRETLKRERSERERFKRYYGIDINDLSIYDVVLNTALFKPDATARILRGIVEELRRGRKHRSDDGCQVRG